MTTADCEHFNTIETWGTDSTTLVLMKGEKSYYVAASSGEPDYWEKNYPVGKRQESFHDQTGRPNNIRTIVGYYRLNKEDLKKIKDLTGRNSIPFSVFK